MTINYQFGDVDAHGAMIRAQAAALEAEHQAIVRDVLAAGRLLGWCRVGGLPGVHHCVGPQFRGDIPAGERPRAKDPGRW